jgi:ribosome-associated protein
MISITDHISLEDSALQYVAVKASGPGGQHVNTTSSAVQLKFDAANNPAIKADVFARLKKLAGQRMSTNGVILLEASSHRSQHRNKADAQERLIALIRAAATVPRARRKTRPSKGSVERRLSGKARASSLKKTRGKVRGDD